MTGSDERDEPAGRTGTRGRDPAERIAAIKRWVRHIRGTSPDRWGPEQNAVVDAQVRAARAADLDAEHRRRVERVARDLAEDDGDE